MKYGFRHLALALALGVLATAAQADPSNKWRIKLDHRADNAGTIVVRISPIGGTPIDVTTEIPKGSGENEAAKLMVASLKAGLDEKAYKVERDDGEDVLIRKKGKTPDFDLSLVSSSITGLTIDFKRE